MNEFLQDLKRGGRPMTKLEYANKEIERLKNEVKEINKEMNYQINLKTRNANEINRLNNIINECAEDILKELEENHHLSYGVALAIRQKLLDYKELKESDEK